MHFQQRQVKGKRKVFSTKGAAKTRWSYIKEAFKRSLTLEILPSTTRHRRKCHYFTGTVSTEKNSNSGKAEVLSNEQRFKVKGRHSVWCHTFNSSTQEAGPGDLSFRPTRSTVSSRSVRATSRDLVSKTKPKQNPKQTKQSHRERDNRTAAVSCNHSTSVWGPDQVNHYNQILHVQGFGELHQLGKLRIIFKRFKMNFYRWKTQKYTTDKVSGIMKGTEKECLYESLGPRTSSGGGQFIELSG